MELWSQNHIKVQLPAMIAMIIIAIILKITIGKKHEKIRMIPFQIVATTLLVLEIIKQINAIVHGYDLYTLPFHFCSLFIFFPFITAFYNGKYKEQIRSFTTITLAMLTLLMFIYPSVIYSGEAIQQTFQNFSSFHTVVFHNLALFGFILIPILGLHKPNTKKDIKAILIGLGFFCLVSCSMAYILKTNFNNFYTCNVPPLEAIRLAVAESAGLTVAQIIYALCVVVMDFVFAFLAYGLYRLGIFIAGKIKNACTKNKVNDNAKTDSTEQKPEETQTT